LRAIDAIERNARAQARLVDDLLDVARIDARKLSIETRPTELAAVIEPAMESLRPAADAKRIAMSCTIAPDVGLVSADATRLQQVVWNILSNAVKFTPPGGRVDIVADRNEDTVRIRVEDTGQGISREFLAHVFERFRQADSSSTRRHAGLGLGLSIVRDLVHLHGGDVFAESEGEGRGSAFTVTLPALASMASTIADHGSGTASRPDRSPTHSLHGIRVMVIDDEDDARHLMDALLSRSGAEVRLHARVDAALEDLTRWNADVIVSDIGMPDRDGYALVHSLRTRDDAQRAIPVIAVSAYARSDDRDRSMAAGFQAHLTKPVDPEELTRTLAAMVGSRGA
jgi:CheY-like chemotaxis protein